jgi:hypothetical protein
MFLLLKNAGELIPDFKVSLREDGMLQIDIYIAL